MTDEEFTATISSMRKTATAGDRCLIWVTPEQWDQHQLGVVGCDAEHRMVMEMYDNGGMLVVTTKSAWPALSKRWPLIFDWSVQYGDGCQVPF